MPRERSPSRVEAKEMYLQSKGEMKLKDIAAELGVLDTQIRKWKSTDKWDNELKGTLPNEKGNVTNKVNKKKKEPVQSKVTEIDNPELNDKQRLFCMYYVKYRNKTKAYMKAYQCSWENANAHAYEMWANVGVRNEIDKQLKELRDELKLDAQDIVQKYIDIAFADITDFLVFGQEEVPVMGAFGPVLDEDGNQVTKMVNTVKFRTWTNVDGTLISEISQGKDGAKLKLHDKMKALDWLAKNTGLLDEATKQKLEIEKRKMALLEKQADDLDEDIEYIVEDDESDEA